MCEEKLINIKKTVTFLGIKVGEIAKKVLKVESLLL